MKPLATVYGDIRPASATGNGTRFLLVRDDESGGVVLTVAKGRRLLVTVKLDARRRKHLANRLAIWTANGMGQ